MPADVNIWVLGVAGFGAGLLGSMLGVGGGIIMVPVLTLALGIPIQYAIGSSLVAIVVNACTATAVYIQRHMTNLKLGLLLATTLVPGAVAGAFIADSLPGNALAIIFGVLLLYIAYAMLPKKRRPLTESDIETIKETLEKDHASHAWLDESYYDPALHTEISYAVHRPSIGILMGFFGGIISSMLGVGGGIINVPVMNQLMKVPIKATIATSTLLLSFTTMTGSLVYAFNGYVLPYVIAPLCISVFIGARLGTAIAQRTRGRVLIIIFAVLLAVTAVMMFLHALNITGIK